MNSIKYVLIDDDLLIRKSWEMAAKKSNIQLLCCKDVAEFMSQLDGLAKDVSIYIDLELGDGLIGTKESHKINDLGFENLYIATGHDPGHVDSPAFIKGIVGKRPPF